MSLSVFSYKPPHDGAIVYLQDGKLVFSIEGEKDNHKRYSGFDSFYRAIKTADRYDVRPDVIAWGGGSSPRDPGDLYHGTSNDIIVTEKIDLFGHSVSLFRSSHERAHIFCSYGLSPFPQGQPVYALVWEGGIGSFYEIDEKMNIHKFETVLSEPGQRYALPYTLANPRYSKTNPAWFRTGSDAGKTMALAAYGEVLPKEKRRDWTKEVDVFMKYKMSFEAPDPFQPQKQKNVEELLEQVQKIGLVDIGVETDDFKDFTYALSNQIFDVFYKFARANLTKGYPLIISGGCGLNCDWNTHWKDSGIFADIFIPPNTNDSGIALGMAIDAQRHFVGNAKLDWTVYSGETFIEDAFETPGFDQHEFSFDQVASLLEQGKVLGWVEGKYEIGPRALCHRSLLAAPFKAEMTERLNKIKKRENFRPIAPVCLEEEVSEHFDWRGPSPFMLFFQKVKSPRLQAVTHINGTARVQTVNEKTNPRMTELLRAFKKKTGFGVLCNTSLNFPGMGFINRISDLVRYAQISGLDGFVVEDRLYLKRVPVLEQSEVKAAPQPIRPYLDLTREITVFQLKNKIETHITPQAVTLHFDAKTDICIFSCPSNVFPFAAPGVVDLSSYHFFRFQALIPKDLQFFVTLTESGANAPESTNFPGVNGADGERYGFPLMQGAGVWQSYQIDLAAREKWKYWGNQHGNNVLDLQGLRSVDFFVKGNQQGEIQLKDLEFLI